MKLFYLLILVTLTSCATPRPSKNCGFHTDVNGSRLSWKKQVPIILTLDESFPVEYVSTLQAAMAEWENITGRQLFILQTGFTNYRDKYLKDGKNVIFLGDLGNSSYLGLTKTWTKGDQITESDIGFSLQGLKLNTMVHELGHLLGLKHSENSSSVMYYSDGYRQELTEEDKLNVRCEY